MSQFKLATTLSGATITHIVHLRGTKRSRPRDPYCIVSYNRGAFYAGWKARPAMESWQLRPEMLNPTSDFTRSMSGICISVCHNRHTWLWHVCNYSVIN
jgi:hypothetical protein